MVRSESYLGHFPNTLRDVCEHRSMCVRTQKHANSLVTHSYHVPGLSMVCQT